MDLISAPYLFVAGSILDKIQNLPSDDTPRDNVAGVLVAVHQQMVDLHNMSGLYGYPLRSAFQAAQFLANQIKAVLDDAAAIRTVTKQELAEIKRLYEQYRAQLLGALSVMGIYLVSQKGSHEVITLLFRGEKLFPDDLIEKVPEAIFDAQETGKCLAYNVPTACGFHAFRVTESVVRRYWNFVTNSATPPKTRSLGVYIAAFNKKGVGDPKVLAALKQMNELHRNPLIHPEARLTTEDALNIAGLARSAVASMLAHLPRAEPTTSNAPLPS